MIRGMKFVLMLCVFTCLLSCTKEVDKELLGKWRNNAGTWDLEFKSDNTGRFCGNEFIYEITRDKYKRWVHISASVKSTVKDYHLFDAIRKGDDLHIWGIGKIRRNNPVWFLKVSD